ncbi:collagen alpha-6(VI) chain-like [Aplysia californica]|uniref:Collagen alpha-6(VI) chain-like n=1 Tax=Aplysia californica TaxID=6500 RepID=A0ABM1AA70_APLCA|nr:collagen alpha-6(VI) chain-like [Aplysia californica]
MGDRQEVPNALIIITDEASNADAKKLKKSSQAVKKKNTKVYTIGVGMKDMSELQTAASDPSNVFSVDTMDDLMSVREQLVGKIKALQGDVSAFMPVFKTVGDLSATKTLDLVFLLHTSKKINRGKYQYYKDFISDIIRGADIDSGKVRVAVAAYRKRGVVIFNLKKYKTMDKVQTAVEGLKLYRSKVGSVAKGLDLVRGKILSKAGGDRPDVPNVVVLLTDAKSTVDEKKIKSSARKVRNAGTKIFAAGIGKAVEPQLKLIASSDDDAFSVASLDDLFAFKEKIVKQVAPHSTKADIAIVFHLSSGIAPANIPKYFVPFLKAILEKANIDGGDVRVSLTNFAKRPRVRFNLAKFKTSADVMKQINAIGRKDRARVGNGANALKNVRTKIFSKKGGDRPDAPNAVILIMDNKSVGNQKVFFREAEQLKATGAKIITVGMAKANAAELRAVASQPADDNAIFAKGYNNIASPDVIEPIRNGIRARKSYVVVEGIITVGMAKANAAELRAVASQPADDNAIFAKGYNNIASPDVIEPIRNGIRARQDRADIVFAVHFNPRGSQADFDRLVSFLQSLIATSDVDGKKVRFGLYIDGGIVKFNLNKNPTNAALARALSSLRRREARVQKFDLERVLQDTRRRMFTPQGGDRLGVPNGLVVITDANSGQDRRALRSESRRAAEAGIGVYTLGIGLSDKGELENVASSSNNVFAFSDYNELERYGALLRKEIRALDTRQAPVPTTRDRVRLSERLHQIPLADSVAEGLDCNPRVDLVFAFQQTKRITESHFRKMVDFAKNVVLYSTEIDDGILHVSAVTFGAHREKTHFGLDKYSSRQAIYWNIDRISRFKLKGSRVKGENSDVFSHISSKVFDMKSLSAKMIIIVMGDQFRRRSSVFIKSAEKAKARGTKVFAIGIGPIPGAIATRVASPPRAINALVLKDFDELSQIDSKHLRLPNLDLCKLVEKQAVQDQRLT